jgi:UDP-N-acetylmuramate--alanine ligase
MNLNQIHNVYFIGIGGIGMSALARYFKNIGKEVAGYDKTSTALTRELDNGIAIHFDDSIDLVPKDFSSKTLWLLLLLFLAHIQSGIILWSEYNIKKRAEVLGIITKDTFVLLSGTHARKQQPSILGHILYESGADVTSFIGGIVENYNSNLVGDGKTVTVVEADEFDRSFAFA